MQVNEHTHTSGSAQHNARQLVPGDLFVLHWFETVYNLMFINIEADRDDDKFYLRTLNLETKKQQYFCLWPNDKKPDIEFFRWVSHDV